MGWWRAMSSCFYLNANHGTLDEWIDDSDSVDELAVLQVFRQQDAATGLFCHAENE